uniref:NLR family pyrin domain containing 12 n=1 Tax=Ursus americanus TaxID=9643 RepID=A0A452RMI2_URSAM
SSQSSIPSLLPRNGLCRLSAYLEELEAVELKKFKLYLGTEAEASRIPWGRLEPAGPLDTARLLVVHCGPDAAWRLALGLFQRINRRDLWERGQREEPLRGKEAAAAGALPLATVAALPRTPPSSPLDPQETYRDYVRRKFRTLGHQASFIQMETLFEPDEERPEPPRTVVLQGAAGMGKSMLAHKVMLDWADGRLFQDRFDYVFYINCREMNRTTAEQSAQDLISSCWPEPGVPLQELVRVPERLLFIIDGFDELKPSFHDPQGPWCLCWEEKRPTELLLCSLIRKKLLPELSVLITTRPTALERLHRWLEHPRHVEILGFSEAERKEYFYKYFHDAEQAGQAFHFVRDNEPLFTLCFVPMVCWVVCTCLKQQLEDGGLLRQTSRTTTAVYVLYLLSLMQPKPGSPAPQPPPNQRGLCSLAAEGLWNRKVLFEERDLRKHGLAGADVSSFLNMNIFQKDINRAKFYSFIHLSFQEFFAAMYYLLDPGERGSGPEQNVTRLLAEYGFSERSFAALTVRFLFGLLNEDTRSYLEKSLGWKVSPHVKAELLRCIQGKAQSEGSTLQQGALELFSCLYEIQEERFIRQALSHFQVVVVGNMATKMEHVIASFCVQSCRRRRGVLGPGVQAVGINVRTSHSDWRLTSTWHSALLCTTLHPTWRQNSMTVLHKLRGDTQSPHSSCAASGTARLCPVSPPCRPEKHVLPEAYSKQLAAALSTNPNLTELVLYRNALGSRGVKLLCQGLRHPGCKLQNLRLRKCQLEAGACREIASVLSTNRHLVELDLTGNALEDLGLRLLCQGLRHPGCRLQILWLKICRLTAAACEELASTLAVNRSLMELDLSLNDLGDPGALLLCEGLRHPQCSLQTVRTHALLADLKCPSYCKLFSHTSCGGLGICRLSSAACEGICTVLRVNPHLQALDLSFNDLGDAGMWPLCEGLRHPTCRLQKLWLDSCGLTAKACEDLSSALGVSQTLRELYLTNNALGNSGVRLLCKGLSHPGCKLQVLWLFGMPLNKTAHRRLAALRLTKPHLDIGC